MAEVNGTVNSEKAIDVVFATDPRDHVVKTSWQGLRFIYIAPTMLASTHSASV